MIDHNGKILRPGVAVRLRRAPPDLLRGLPDDAQAAICWAAGEVDMLLVGMDDYGNVELEFEDPDGDMHWIFVKPNEVELAQA